MEGRDPHTLAHVRRDPLSCPGQSAEMCRRICINSGEFCRRFSWRIFLDTFSHENEHKKSGDKIREKSGCSEIEPREKSVLPRTGPDLSRNTCCSARVTADFLRFSCVAVVSRYTPPKGPVAPVAHQERRTSNCLSKGVALHRGVAATVRSVALHCVTMDQNFRVLPFLACCLVSSSKDPAVLVLLFGEFLVFGFLRRFGRGRADSSCHTGGFCLSLYFLHYFQSIISHQ